MNQPNLPGTGPAPAPEDQDLLLADQMAPFYGDPLGFVLYAFPWGSERLSGEDGPDKWQREVLEEIGRAVRERNFDFINAVEPIRMARASGHGIGKSALVAWIILWVMSTRVNARGTVTANTATQLETKTWSELNKWARLCITGHWMKISAANIRHKDHPMTWRIDAVTCEERNSEAFAGQHAADSSSIYIFDEACHDDQTDVMTNRGWVRFQALSQDDLLLTPEGWQKPSAIHVSHRDGVMKSIERRGLSMMVTPNHDMWLESRKTGKLRRRSISAVSLNQEMAPRVVEWSGAEYPISDDQLTLDAWYYSEGHLLRNVYVPKGTGGGRAAIGRKWHGFGITNREDRDITALLDRLGLRWATAKSSTPQWLVYDPKMADRYAEQGVGCIAKTIPQWMFSLSQRQMRLFLDTYAEGDGYRRSPILRVIYTSSPTMANDLHALACLAGFNSSLTKRSLAGKRNWIKDHWAESSTDGYVLTLSETGARAAIGREMITDVQYEGMVYCATVPAGLLLTRRNGTVIWSGNSAVPDKIWEVAEGGLTDGEPMFFAFGNPTRNSGKFREIFGRLRHRWNAKQIDSRDTKKANKTLIEQWRSDYGEDSDFFRVRVKGDFPRAGSTQFISSEVVAYAKGKERDVPVSLMDPMVIGVDVARFGDDQSVIFFRRGLDARSIPMLKFRGLDTMQLAARVAEAWERFKADAIFVDETGVGAGVVDRLRYLRLPVTGVNNGAKPDRTVNAGDAAMVGYADKVTEMAGVAREWLKYGIIPDDRELVDGLTNREYGYVIREGKDVMKLEKKDDMKKRGLASPDEADAFYLTFAYPVGPSDHRGVVKRGGGGNSHQTDYDPMAQMVRS